jgi:Trypsin
MRVSGRESKEQIVLTVTNTRRPRTYRGDAMKRILLSCGTGCTMGLVTFPLLYQSCSRSSTAQPQIVGGFEVTDKTSFGPLLSSTVAISTPSLLLSGKSFCSGTLIGTKTILTAAHCLSDDQGRQVNTKLLVFFGPRVEDGGANGKSVFAREVTARRIHPEYNHQLTVSPARRSTSANDLALLTFSGEIPKGYAPAKLATNEQAISQDIVLAGFGTTGTLMRGADGRLARGQDGAPASLSDTGLLRAVKVVLAAEFGAGKVFFVNSPDGRPRGACPGDSGGPAYYQVPPNKGTGSSTNGQQWVLGGALSTGLEGIGDVDGDGTADTNCVGQNFYTDIRGYNTWIKSTMAALGDLAESVQPDSSTAVVPVAGLPVASPEPIQPKAPPRRSGKVYWVTNGISKQFQSSSEQLQIALFNDSSKSFNSCYAVAEIDSERTFFVWTLQLRDTLRSTKASMGAGKVTQLLLNRSELADWRSLRYQAMGVRLFCDGAEIRTEILESQSVETLAYN